MAVQLERFAADRRCGGQARLERAYDRQHRGARINTRRAQKGQHDRALGRSRGGFSTKLHLRCDGSGRLLAFALSSGERHGNLALTS
jgi:hypothetical protein